MQSIIHMSGIDSEQTAVEYLKDSLLRGSQFLDKRQMFSVSVELKRQFSECPANVVAFIRGALAICLFELQDRNSAWYQQNDDGGSRAEDLLVFANDDGRIVDSSNREVILDLVEAIPRDIVIQITQESLGIQERCEQTMIGLLTNDEPSRIFVEKTKAKYTKEYWSGKTNYAEGFWGMERFYGVSAAFEFAVEKKATYDLLFDVAVSVNASPFKDDWRVLFAEKSSADLGKNETLFLKAVELGLEEEIDGSALLGIMGKDE